MAELHTLYARKSVREEYQVRCDAYVQSAKSELQKEARQLIADCTHADPTQRLTMTAARERFDSLIGKIQHANS